MFKNKDPAKGDFVKLISRFWFVTASLNMEIVVIPVILKGYFGLSGYELLFKAILWATVELAYWHLIYYEIVGFLSRRRIVQNTISYGRSIAKDIKMGNVKDKAKESFFSHVDPDKYRDSKLVAVAKGGSLLGIFTLGMAPFGIWLAGLAICKKTSWKIGFVALYAGNMLKNAAFVLSWDGIWRLFG